ncbi:MAG TPA: regulatory protein RecX [Solirubrobacteraceae bacterium]
MREHLLARGTGPEVADAAVEELVEQGTLDDERFARLFVEDKRGLEQWGTERIRRGLVARGIDRELAEQALAQGPEPRGDDDRAEPESELDRALALLEKRFPEPPVGRRGRERALGVLLRKGYEYELALEAIGMRSREDA